MTGEELASRLHRDLGLVAREAQWSPDPEPGQPLGSYTDPIADAVEAAGVPSVEAAGMLEVRVIRRVALAACLERLERHFAALVDVSTPEWTEKQGMIAQALGRLRAERSTELAREALGAARGAKLRTRRRPDYTLGEGDDE